MADSRNGLAAALALLIALAWAAPAAGAAPEAPVLTIRGHSFVPGVESSLPAALPELGATVEQLVPAALRGTPAATAQVWIVDSSERPAVARQRLADAGFEVLERLPPSAWLVRAPADVALALPRLPGTRWAGRFTPAHVVLPQLASRLAAPPVLDPSGLVRLELDFLPGVDAREHESLLRSIEGVTVLGLWTPADGAHVAKLGVRPESLRPAVVALARLHGASALLPDDVPVPHADQSAWSVQTGIDMPGAASPGYDVTAKLWRNGVTGRGVLVAIADEGLENDNCKFRYGSDVNEAAWPIGPASLDLDPVPAEEAMPSPPTSVAPLRTRDRKVVAYYVQGGAAAYSSSWQHGTTVASLVAGDDHATLAARPLVRDLGLEQLLPGWGAPPTWTVGQELRPDLLPRVDDPRVDDPLRSSPFAVAIEHHDAADGMAPGAQVVFQDIGAPDGTLMGTFTAGSLLGQAHDTGATAFNVSFGSGPCTNCYAGQAQGGDQQLWVRRDLVLVVSAGNDGASGSSTIGGGFAHGKSAIVAGSTRPADAASSGAPRPGEDVSSFSARGPKSGSLLAPDVMAPGEVDAIQPGLARPEDGSGSGDADCSPSSVRRVAGTSFSSATVTGAAALVQQYFADGYYPSGSPTPSDALRPTNALVRAVLVNSARDLGGARTDGTGTGRAHRPSHGQGWGAVRLDDTLFFVGDPTMDDPRGDTERARLLVLNDTPNGLDPACAGCTLAPEPGGATRDALVASFQPAIADGQVHEFVVRVMNPDPSSAANELRVTLAWSDVPGATGSATTLVNDLDLELVSPGPNGLLESAAGALGGDDVAYRPDHRSAWSLGYTVPSPTRALQSAAPPFADLADRERFNTVENVFLASRDVVQGDWLVRVIGYDVPGSGGVTRSGRPNFVNGDVPPSLDLDGDGVPETETHDLLDPARQGYALIVSGNADDGRSCTAAARVGLAGSARPCVGDTIVLDASSSSLRNCAGAAEYRFESPLGAPIPGGDWDASSTRDLALTAPGPLEVHALLRCSTDTACASTSAPLRLDVQPIPTLDFPGPVSVSPEGDCRLRVSWTEATSSAAPLVYDLYRDTGLPVTRDAAHLVASGLSATTWLDDVPWGAGHAYRVVARVECREEPNAGGDSPLVAPVDASPPAFAGIVDTRDLGYCQVEVSWDESTAVDDCSGIAGYDVYRDHGVAHAGETLVAAGVPGSPYIDTTPGNGTWIYVVRAVNGAGLDDGNEIFQQESEGSCRNDFPRDAGLDRENGVDPPRADRFRSAPGGPREGEWDTTRLRLHAMTIDISWLPSPDEGGLYPVTYSVVRGTLQSLREGAYDHELVLPDACGIAGHELAMPDQVDGVSRYYLVVAVSGDNATYGYDSFGREIEATPVCP